MKRAAVTYRDDDKVTPYEDALRLVGLDPVLVSPEQPLSSLASVDGLVLTGGTDLNPKLYGQEPHPRTEDPDNDRDALEQRLLQEALDRDIPVLAICRGMQLFNVVHAGGTLVQHMEGHEVRGNDPSRPAHLIRTRSGAVLEQILGSGDIPVNSRHHQAVMQVGEGLRVSATAPDGTVEALERPDLRFAVAVQWHPENQVFAFAEQRRLFEAFRDSLGGPPSNPPAE